ncbi:MAG: ribosomal protein S18-alanine N-acetyltransferase [Parvibaculales bacterium]
MTNTLKPASKPDSAPGFEVRPLDPPHSTVLIEELAALHQDGFERPWSPASLRQTLERPVARSWGAFAAGETVKPLGFLTCDWVAREAEILTFAVAPFMRRSGVGGALLGTMMAAAENTAMSRIFLEVAETNIAALRLYERAGFARTGRRTGYYAGTDALLMEYSL